MEELEIFYEDTEALVASHDKRLSVVISADSLSSFVQSATRVMLIQRSKVTAVDELAADVHNLVAYHSISSVKIFLDSPLFALLPAELTDFASIREQVSVSFTVQPYDEIEITNLDSVNVCFVKNNSIIRALSPKVSLESQEHLISQLLRNCAEVDEGCFCFFLEQSFYVVLKSKGVLLIATRYEYRGQNDVLYYLQMIHRYINPIGSIYLSGFISEESKVLVLLRNYFSEVLLQHSKLQDRFNFVLT